MIQYDPPQTKVHCMPVNSIKIGEQIIQMLDRGAQTSTYKYAVMLAILDLCIEKNLDAGTGATIRTPELALKVAELYWPHVRQYTKGNKKEILQQIIWEDKTGTNHYTDSGICHQTQLLLFLSRGTKGTLQGGLQKTAVRD